GASDFGKILRGARLVQAVARPGFDERSGCMAAGAGRRTPARTIEANRSKETRMSAVASEVLAGLVGQVPAGVGSEKLFENDKIIVWNFVLEPGEETPIHTHEYNYVWYAINGAPLQVFDEHGKDLGTLDVPTGAVYVLKLEDGF